MTKANEIRVTAAIGGRQITLEPLHETTLAVPVRTVESTIPCGFQVDFLTGDDPATGIKLELGSGAGFGSCWLTLVVTLPDGRKVYECLDAQDLAEIWAKAVTEREGVPT